jgi:hypothetical protein
MKPTCNRRKSNFRHGEYLLLLFLLFLLLLLLLLLLILVYVHFLR